MNLVRRLRRLVAALAALAATLAAPVRAGEIGEIGGRGGRGGAELKADYLFNFATSAGSLFQTFQGLTYDAAGSELYVVSQGLVRVFNAAGVEVFSFGDAPELGGVVGAAPLESGDVLLLATSTTDWWLLRTSFRGELKARVSLSGIPAAFPMKDFRPVAIRYAKGKVYVADRATMRVLVLDFDGAYLASYDLAELLQAGDKRADLGIRGFNVDREGNLLFTVSPEFKAYILAPSGQMRVFGKAGSAPGRFGVVSGIASDDEGRIFVTDVLRCQVIVFDKNLEFVGEFGGRGFDAASLIGPNEVVVASGKVYVTQGARRGVSVFTITGG